jgi:hypothetical protein
MAISTKNNKQTITVKTNEENPEPLELIAASIITIADGIRKINSSRLKKRAVLLLLRDVTGIGMNEIEKIIDCADKLEAHFVKVAAKK